MVTTEDTEDFIKMEQVAEILGITYNGVYALVARGTLKPAQILLGRYRLFRRSDIVALAEHRKTHPVRGGYRGRKNKKSAVTDEANKKGP